MEEASRVGAAYGSRYDGIRYGSGKGGYREDSVVQRPRERDRDREPNAPSRRELRGEFEGEKELSIRKAEGAKLGIDIDEQDVINVIPGGAGERAGLTRGMQITAVNDVAVFDHAALVTAMAAGGNKFHITVIWAGAKSDSKAAYEAAQAAAAQAKAAQAAPPKAVEPSNEFMRGQSLTALWEGQWLPCTFDSMSMQASGGFDAPPGGFAVVRWPDGTFSSLLREDVRAAAACGDDDPERICAAPAAEWKQHFDEQSQRLYWHNPVTGEARWTPPEGQ